MSYSETLNSMIKKSGLSLSQIAIKCKELFSISVDPSYISKLKSGNQAPASDEVNIAIAKACGGDPDNLVFEAYMEKAPDIVKKLIRGMSEMGRQFVYMQAQATLPKEQLEMIKIQLEQVTDREIIEMSMDNPIVNDFGQDNSLLVNSPTEDKLKILLNPYTGIPMPDKAMEPALPEGALLQVHHTDEVKSGSIVLITNKDNDYFVRRYIRIKDSFVLTADNSDYEPIEDVSNYQIQGVVKSYLKEV